MVLTKRPKTTFSPNVPIILDQRLSPNDPIFLNFFLLPHAPGPGCKNQFPTPISISYMSEPSPLHKDAKFVHIKKNWR